MPELPEVENLVCGLRPDLEGAIVRQVIIRWAGALTGITAEEFTAALVGRRITQITRRGKWIAIEAPPGWLLVHLRMTGSLRFSPQRDAELEADRHVHLWFALDRGWLYYRDPRKFGRLRLVPDPGEVTAALGAEPLDPTFTADELAVLLAAHRRQIKPLLLDQHALAGLGNIYVDESLWQAGIHPLRRSHTIGPREVHRLHSAIVSTLRQAVTCGGTTVRDYRGAHNEPGAFQLQLAAYGRQGQPCPRCGRAIERIVVGQRGTHVCPVCQPLVLALDEE